VEKAPVPYHTLNPDGILTDVSEKWCQIFGYKKEEVIGKSIFNFISDNERKTAEDSFKEKIQSKKPYTGGHERAYLTKDGEEKIFVIHDFFSYDIDNNIVSVHTTMEDITERKTAEDELRESEEKYRAIFNLSPQAIIVIDKNGVFLDANNRIYEWTNYKPKEIIGKSKALVEIKVFWMNLEVPVRLRMTKRSGIWKVYDLSALGISAVGNYRAQFHWILQKRSPEQVIELLKEKSRSLENEG